MSESLEDEMIVI